MRVYLFEIIIASTTISTNKLEMFTSSSEDESEVLLDASDDENASDTGNVIKINLTRGTVNNVPAWLSESKLQLHMCEPMLYDCI